MIGGRYADLEGYSGDVVDATYVNIEDNNMPGMLTLNCYPNPFIPAVTINCYMPQSGERTVKRYDIRGAQVATVVDQVVPRGWRTVHWNSSCRVAAVGLRLAFIFCRAAGAGATETKEATVTEIEVYWSIGVLVHVCRAKARRYRGGPHSLDSSAASLRWTPPALIMPPASECTPPSGSCLLLTTSVAGRSCNIPSTRR